MAKWKRAGPTTQLSVDQNYLLLNFFLEFPREKKSKHLPQINKRDFGEIYTSLPTNHKTRSRVLIKLQHQQDGAVEACWAHNPEVCRSKLTPANFFSRISEKKIETVTSQIHKRESGDIYTTFSQKNHNTRSAVFVKP